MYVKKDELEHSDIDNKIKYKMQHILDTIKRLKLQVIEIGGEIFKLKV